MKIYYDGQYLDSSKLTPEDLKNITKNNPSKFAIIAGKFGWKIKEKENESINLGNTKKKSGKVRQTKRSL